MLESIYFFLFCHLISFIVWMVLVSINALKRETIYLLFAILKPLAVSFGSSITWNSQQKVITRFRLLY